jgi:outer membrane protein assembly factor BamB
VISIISIFITLLAILSSCSDDYTPINFRGDGRNNNYEDRSLYSSDYFVFDILKDSLSDKNIEGLKWPLLMSKNGGMIWCGRDNKIKLLSGSAFRWEYDLKNQKIIAPFSISPEGDIIFITSDNSVHSLDKNGQIKWQESLLDSLSRFNEKKYYNAILTLKKYFVVTSSDGNIIFFDYSGNILSELNLPVSTIGNPLKVNDSTLIISTSHFHNSKSDSVYILQNKKIKNRLGIKNSRIIIGAISSDEKIFVSSLKSENNENKAFVTSFDIKGNIIWEKNIEHPAMKLSSDDEENIYCLLRENKFDESNNWVIKIDKNGKFRWKLFFDNNIRSDLLIGENNIALFATKENSQGLFYINKQNGKLYSTLSFGQAPDLNPFCAISKGGMIYFGANNEDKIIKIEKDMLDWR